MARKSSVDGLPPDVRAWLIKVLTDGNFNGYAQFEALLKEKGYIISRSAIHRFGQKIEKRMVAIKECTEAAKLIAEGAADDQDARSEAVIAMIQTQLFESLVEFQNAEGETNPVERMNALSKVAKNIATLTRASLSQKQFKAEVKAKAEAAVLKITEIVKKSGLDKDAVDAIRKQVLGIVE